MVVQTREYGSDEKFLLFALPPLWEDVSSTCLFLSSTLMKLVSSSTVSRIRSSKAALDRYRTIKDWIRGKGEGGVSRPPPSKFLLSPYKTYFSNKSFNRFINKLNFEIANILLDDINRIKSMFYNFLKFTNLNKKSAKLCEQLKLGNFPI